MGYVEEERKSAPSRHPEEGTQEREAAACGPKESGPEHQGRSSHFWS